MKNARDDQTGGQESAASNLSALGAPGGLPPPLPPFPCDCAADPIGGLKRMFVDFAQGRSIASGRDPATRPVFLRLHGVAHAVLEVHEGLHQDLRVGVFAKPGSFSAWVRFSSDLQPGVPDAGGTIGVAFKLFGVDGETLLDPDTHAGTHDFIFQNHDVFFVPDAHAMCEFTCASLHGRKKEYTDAHPITEQILSDMAKPVASLMETVYWSVLPFHFGEKRFVKYKLEVEAAPAASGPTDTSDPGYLRADLIDRLARGGARLRLLVQFQTNDSEMPLDDATVQWSEDASPPVHLATLVIPRQDLRVRGQDAYGENLAFNIARTLSFHRPVGSLAAVRELAYRASADNRRNVNGQPLAEPHVPRPPQYEPGVDYPPAKDRRIVRASIHPAIGIARVGNSQESFVGPQVVRPEPKPAGFYRDGKGALRRQTAEFRIYGYNAAGDVVAEITSNTAVVRWSVHLVNSKAAWFRWRIAMDVPEAATVAMPPRNANVAGPDRKSLVIDTGQQTVQGSNSQCKLSGKFQGVDVMLGEACTDAAGRLQVIGGLGFSSTPGKTPIFVQEDDDSFGNADGWHDDVADGPVTAQVLIDGQPIPVEPAWVVSAPPNYAPDVKGLRTMYDLLKDMFLQAGWIQPTGIPSFREDIYPILERLSGLQWVNQGFATQFGHLGPLNFNDLGYAAALSRRGANTDADREVRRRIVRSFRPPQQVDGNQLPWPWLYGDAMQSVAGPSPRQNAAISNTQMRLLERWIDGDYEDDWGSPQPEVSSLDKVPLEQRPAMLDRAALEFCLADAFHPGCEMTWPMRHLTMFSAPFRLRHRGESTPAWTPPKALTQSGALAVDGPLFAQGPGDLTRWMALPWQADTAFCRSGYDHAYDPFLPSFWPARVPNHVLTKAAYDGILATVTSPEKRRELFMKRTNWNDPLGRKSVSQIMLNMVDIFGSMGVLETRPGRVGDPSLPSSMLVASYGPGISDAGQAREAAQERLKTRAFSPALAGTPLAELEVAPGAANFPSSQEALDAPLPVRLPKA